MTQETVQIVAGFCVLCVVAIIMRRKSKKEAAVEDDSKRRANRNPLLKERESRIGPAFLRIQTARRRLPNPSMGRIRRRVHPRPPQDHGIHRRKINRRETKRRAEGPLNYSSRSIPIGALTAMSAAAARNT